MLYSKPDVILQYYRSLEQNINKKNYSALLSGDLNRSSFDWERFAPIKLLFLFTIKKCRNLHHNLSFSLLFLFFDCKNEPFQTKTNSLCKWQFFRFTLNIFSQSTLGGRPYYV